MDYFIKISEQRGFKLISGTKGFGPYLSTELYFVGMIQEHSL
jgi:hypothetical protein